MSVIDDLFSFMYPKIPDGLKYDVVQKMPDVVEVDTFMVRPRGKEYRIEDCDGNPTLFILTERGWEAAEIFNDGLDNYGRIHPGRFARIKFIGATALKHRIGKALCGGYTDGVDEALARLNLTKQGA